MRISHKRVWRNEFCSSIWFPKITLRIFYWILNVLSSNLIRIWLALDTLVFSFIIFSTISFRNSKPSFLLVLPKNSLITFLNIAPELFLIISLKKFDRNSYISAIGPLKFYWYAFSRLTENVRMRAWLSRLYKLTRHL